MTVEDLLKYYGNGYKFKKRTGMSDGSFRNWVEWGFVPEGSQYKIERLTNGDLKCEFSEESKQLIDKSTVELEKVRQQEKKIQSTFTSDQVEFIRKKMTDWHIKWNNSINFSDYTKLVFAKNQLEAMILGE